MLTADVSALYGERVRLRPVRSRHAARDDIQGAAWAGRASGRCAMDQIVKWTNFAMINAEELGVGRQTIEEAMKSQKPDIGVCVGPTAVSASRWA